MALNVQFGGFKFFLENLQNIGYLYVWKLQRGEIIVDTECVRFAKIIVFIKNVGRFFAK